MQKTSTATSSIFYLYLLPALLLNLLFVLFILTIGGVTPREVDFWISINYFGGYSRNPYVMFLLESYFISALIGLFTAYLLFRPFFRTLLKKNEVTTTTRKLGIALAGIIAIPAYAIFLFFDQIAAYILSDHNPLVGFTSNSTLSIFVLTGFITGVAILMISFPLRVYRKSRRENMRLWAETLAGTSADGRKLPSRIRWSFEKRPS